MIALTERNGAVVGKRVTVEDIAQKLGLSSMTVSRALNDRPNVGEETRERVLQAAREMGYRPNRIAKSLVLSKTYTIGIVLPKMAHFFFPEVIRGVETVTHDKGYQLILTHSAEDAEREIAAIQTLESSRVDGILISMAQSTSNYEEYTQIMKSGMPLVFFDRCAFGIGASCVSVDDRDTSRRAIEHLIDVHGRKRIAHLKGPVSVSVGKDRFDGYKDGLEANGLPYEEELVSDSSFNEKGGYEAMMKILQLPKDRWPDGVFAVNDPAAIGAIEALKEAGLRIPEDIGIIGFTDDPRAPLTNPPLTTVRQPAFEIGKTAAQRLISLIDEEREVDDVDEIVVKSDLIIRNSCGCQNGK